MNKHMVVPGVVVLFLLLLSGCTEQTATQQTPSSPLTANQVPRVEECRVEYFDRNDPATVFFVGVASDADGIVVLYSWNISDGFTINQQSFVHTFSHPGVYQAQLTVMDDKGAVNSTSIAVYVYDTTSQNQQRDEAWIIGRWENSEGTVIEFTSNGMYIVPREQMYDRYWLSQAGLYRQVIRTNETLRYEYFFQDGNTLVLYQTGHQPTPQDTWWRVS